MICVIHLVFYYCLEMFQVCVMYLFLSPPQELLFSGESNSDIICTLTLTNISKNTVAYKVRLVGEEVARGICHSTDMVSSMGVWSYSYKAHI